jgi:hypothetical protein
VPRTPIAISRPYAWLVQCEYEGVSSASAYLRTPSTSPSSSVAALGPAGVRLRDQLLQLLPNTRATLGEVMKSDFLNPQRFALSGLAKE